MSDYIQLENIPATANSLLNILWEQNRSLTATELTELYNQRSLNARSKQEIKKFLNLLVRYDYVEGRRHGLKIYYSALGSECKYDLR